MKKSIDRTYELSAEEVKNAIYRYLKEFRDQPMPADPADVTVKCDSSECAYVSFQERIDLETGKVA